MDFDGEEGIRWNNSWNASLPIGQVRRDTNPARAADSHPFDSIKEACEHVLAIDSQRREQRNPVIIDSPTIVQTPTLTPSNWVAATQPHPQTKVVKSPPRHGRPSTRIILEQFHALLHGVSPRLRCAARRCGREARAPAPNARRTCSESVNGSLSSAGTASERFLSHSSATGLMLQGQ